MRAVIQGKRYDTETATLVASTEHGQSTRDFRFFTETLYLTPRGSWFLAGRGNGLSPYGAACGGMRGSEERITPLCPGEAQEWLEVHGKVNTLEAYFGELIEDA